MIHELTKSRLPISIFAFFPLSTSIAINIGIGNPINTAKNTKAGLISPVASVIAPTIAGPNTLLPLSVTAYRAKKAASLPSGTNSPNSERQ